MFRPSTDLAFRFDLSPDSNFARVVAVAAALAASITDGTSSAAATLDRAPYGTTEGGQAVEIFTMTNDRGLRVRFLSLGGVITEIDAPDRTGRGGVGGGCGQQHRIQAGRAADLRGYRMRRRVQSGLPDHSAGQLVAAEQLDVGVHERLRVEIRLVRLARFRRRRCDEERHRTAILLRLVARNPDRSRGADYGSENNYPPALANR